MKTELKRLDNLYPNGVPKYIKGRTKLDVEEFSNESYENRYEFRLAYLEKYKLLDTLVLNFTRPVDGKYGAPMGRYDNPAPDGNYDVATTVPMHRDAGYDLGGAYWGIGEGEPVCVKFTLDLRYWEYYR